jgi:hypothetical protein
MILLEPTCLFSWCCQLPVAAVLAATYELNKRDCCILFVLGPVIIGMPSICKSLSTQPNITGVLGFTLEKGWQSLLCVLSCRRDAGSLLYDSLTGRLYAS